ncbi:alginate export family protein [Pseudoalteromonas haloplanktis]|uniref:Alginate export family protein n=1 Tax=Pseudoalteromonas haloplanktis TaxID=228 RepID=A0ABU1BAY0_PSEHA|nr:MULTISPECIES: alginate export family protein [Pseudoalteromonas]MDQ9091427.1 alginate export family protein [Pseudoalteromonas haloplanktis]TMN70662.1 hypothetical protein CWB85_14790 [Pseudoalteromonas sp. S1727]
MTFQAKLSKVTTLLLLAGTTATTYADTQSKTTLDFNIRYEGVQQDNILKDASALTISTRLNYTSADYQGFSGVIEFEDSRQLAGVDNYNDAIGNNLLYSVIADPESTELDQAFLQYKSDKLTAKVGRQIIALDNQRYVGHVGWRQDRQTFDAATLNYTATSKINTSYSYINKRNRIFAEAKDLHSNDHLLHINYKTELGLLTGYSYLLEVDEGTPNSLDTYGLSFKGKKDNFAYLAEYASQQANDNGSDHTADYIALEGAYSFNTVTVKLGGEVLGSDNAQYSFSTPLATLHKFNGWADQFLTTPKEGLVDLYASVSGKVLGGAWSLVYHDYSADEATPTVDNLGSEINAVFTRKFAKNLTVGIKYAAYSAGDVGAGKVDTDKIWLWLGAKF